MLRDFFNYLHPHILHYLKNSLDSASSAFGSAIGAFIPIFLLMCIHYWIRKVEYKRRKTTSELIQKTTRSIIEIDEQTLGTIYSGLNVTDYPDFLEKMKGSRTPTDIKLINMVTESVNRRFQNIQNSLDLTTEQLYLDNYSFKTYLSNILDRHYPDSSNSRKSDKVNSK